MIVVVADMSPKPINPSNHIRGSQIKDPCCISSLPLFLSQAYFLGWEEDRAGGGWLRSAEAWVQTCPDHDPEMVPARRPGRFGPNSGFDCPEPGYPRHKPETQEVITVMMSRLMVQTRCATVESRNLHLKIWKNSREVLRRDKEVIIETNTWCWRCCYTYVCCFALHCDGIKVSVVIKGLVVQHHCVRRLFVLCGSWFLSKLLFLMCFVRCLCFALSVAALVYYPSNHLLILFFCLYLKTRCGCFYCYVEWPISNCIALHVPRIYYHTDQFNTFKQFTHCECNKVKFSCVFMSVVRWSLLFRLLTEAMVRHILLIWASASAKSLKWSSNHVTAFHVPNLCSSWDFWPHIVPLHVHWPVTSDAVAKHQSSSSHVFVGVL